VQIAAGRHYPQFVFIKPITIFGSKMVAENWLGNFFEMGQSRDFQSKSSDFDILMTPIKTVAKKEKIVESSGILTSKDVKLLLATRDLVEEYRVRLEEHLRANTFTTTKANSLSFSTNTIYWYVFSVLSTAKVPLHVNTIISRMETKGWVSKSKHHKYSQIRQILTDNFSVYKKVAPATFVIRPGFKRKSQIEVTKKIETFSLSTEEASTTDLVVSMIAKYGSMYPGSIWLLTKRMGLNYTYNSIYKSLQNENVFMRDGYCYQIKPNAQSAITDENPDQIQI